MQVNEEEHSWQTKQQVKQVEEETTWVVWVPPRKLMWLQKSGRAKEGVTENEGREVARRRAYRVIQSLVRNQDLIYCVTDELGRVWATEWNDPLWKDPSGCCWNKGCRGENENRKPVRKLLWWPRQGTVVTWSTAVVVEVKGFRVCGQKYSWQDLLMYRMCEIHLTSQL